MNLNIPYMETDNKLLNDAYRIAAGGYCRQYRILPERTADGGKALYDRGAGLQYPVDLGYGNQHLERVEHFVSGGFKNTLLAVLEEEEGNIYIGGQYWDSIIWMIGVGVLQIS